MSDVQSQPPVSQPPVSQPPVSQPPPVAPLSHPAGPRHGDRSIDGGHWWDQRRKRWEPVASTKIEISASTAFKIGFFGYFGALVAAIFPTLILLLLFGSCIAAALPRR